jgi:hypothetical protein
MNTSTSPAPASRDLLTVDLRGMKAALCARAQARGVPVAALVREALARDGLGEIELTSQADAAARSPHRVRVSLRLARTEARELTERARVAGRPVGSYIVELMRSGREPPSAVDRAAGIAALARSNAELATLSRHIAHLTALLRQGAVRAAQEYRQTLDALDGDVRSHLTQASAVLAQQTARRG